MQGRLPGLGTLIFLVLAVLLGPTGCSSEDPERIEPVPPQGEESGGGVLRILHEHARDLDPRVVDDIYESTIVNQVFDGLVRYDSNLGIAPSLAESWIVSQDGIRYTFRLREGLAFHDGTSLEAGDVVASLQRALAVDRPGECLAETYLLQIRGAREYRSGRASRIEGLRAPDARTVEVELEEPLSFFLSVLAMDQTRIVRTNPTGHSLDGNGTVDGTAGAGIGSGVDPDSSLPIGTGPFRFARRESLGDREELVLCRHDRYWGSPSFLDSLVFVSWLDRTPTDREKIDLLLEGEIDGVEIASSEVSSLSTLGFRVTAAPELAISFLGLETSTPPLDDVRVRRAIAHCVDRDAFVGVDGREIIPASGILPPGLPGYLPSPLVLPYDPARAAELLLEAGYSRETPAPTLQLYASGEGRSYEFLSGPFRDTLRELGVPVEVEILGWVDLDRRVTEGEAPLFLLGWLADVPDADGFLFALFHSKAANNLFGFRETAVDRGLEEARHMSPGRARVEKYREIESRILEAGVIVPLYHDLTCFAWNPAFVGVESGPYGLPSLRFSQVQRLGTDPPAIGLAEDRP